MLAFIPEAASREYPVTLHKRITFRSIADIYF